MSVVFTKTAKSSAVGSFQSALFVATLSCVFGAVALLIEQLPIVMKVIFACVGFATLFWVASLIRQGLRYLKSGKDWRVEVTSRKVSWQSPVHETMASFELPLADIQTLRHVATKVGTRNAGPSHDYTIELRNGDVIDVSDQISGIHPEKVFEAMLENGVPFEREFVNTKEQASQKREQKRARRRAVKAKQRPHTVSVVSSA